MTEVPVQMSVSDVMDGNTARSSFDVTMTT